MKYRIYIDEVGNPDLNSSDNPNHRFLSLTGVILELEYVKNVVHMEMENLKKKFFASHPDDPVVLHRKELINAKPPFEALRYPQIRAEFDIELLALIESWEFTVISVCLDKKTHREKYSVWRYEPYHYCLAILLERFVFFLNRIKCKGDVIAESRGGKEDMKLKKAFSRLWMQGTDFVDPEQIQNVLTSKELKVKNKSNNISGLQLSDLLAHPSRNEIMFENGILQKKPAPFAQKIIKILADKYDRGENQTFGKKFI